MSDTDKTGPGDVSNGPDVETVPADASTDDATLEVNPEVHQAATDDLADPGERPQVDEDIARGRGRS